MASDSNPFSSITGAVRRKVEKLAKAAELVDGLATEHEEQGSEWVAWDEGGLRDLVGEVIEAKLPGLDDELFSDHIALWTRHKVDSHGLNGWKSKGRSVYGTAKVLSGPELVLEASSFRVTLNAVIWPALTGLQRVAVVYHELLHCCWEWKGREGEEELKPGIRPHQFEGWPVELALFGSELFSERRLLKKALQTELEFSGS